MALSTSCHWIFSLKYRSSEKCIVQISVKVLWLVGKGIPHLGPLKSSPQNHIFLVCGEDFPCVRNLSHPAKARPL